MFGCAQEKTKFVIMTPMSTNGGVIALEKLCSELCKKGYSAKVFYDLCVYRKNFFCFFTQHLIYLLKNFIKLILVRMLLLFKIESKKYYNGYIYKPVRGNKIKFLPFVAKNTIVIYPDIIYGNPLRAKKVVRWLLYYNRFKNDPDAYGTDDLFFAYREIFNDYDLNPQCNLLHVSHFDLDLYKQTNFGERNGTCYVIRKGKSREDLPKEFDGVIIDDLSEPEKVKAFNRCEKCISYDTQTAYSSIAALCGCLSIVVPEPGKKRTDYLHEDLNYGVAYGDTAEERNFAISTQYVVREQYLKDEEQNEEEVGRFLKTTLEYFYRKDKNINDAKN